MFAVIKTGGKQYRVAADDVIEVARVAGEPGEIVEFGEVLVVGGDSVSLGLPTVAGATVAAEVIEQGRGAEGDRLQEAPPQEFAAQARPPAGVHAGPDHRDPHRRRQAEQDRRAPSAEPKPAAAEAAAPDNAEASARKPASRPSRRRRKPGQGNMSDSG